VFRRNGVAITVEWAGPRDGYERFSNAKRRDDYGTVTTLRADRLADWLAYQNHFNEPNEPIGPM